MSRAPRPAGPLVALAAALLFGPLLLAACGQQSALGEANTIVVVAPDDSLWQQVRDTTYAALEPTIRTVREEKKFYVQEVDTTATPEFGQLRTFKRVVVFGTPDNRFVREVADAAGREVPSPPALVHARDVWARGQAVTAVVLDPDRPVEAWRSQLAALAEHVEGQYRRFVGRRMFVSGLDSAASDSLRDRFGFGLGFPAVYDVAVRGAEGPVIVRNDNPNPAELIRSVLVDWRSPPLDTLTAERAYGWRSAVDSLHYAPAHAVDTASGRQRRLEVAEGRSALEVTGVWSDEGTSYPAGGPFVARLVQCPERTYFLDAWIYAPGEDKYQYLLQVREILDSFTCGEPPPIPEPAASGQGG